MMRLKSKRVVVTGGSSGIGRAVCELFAREGAELVIGDIDDVGGAQTMASIDRDGGKASFRKTDISNEDDVRLLVEFAEGELGGIDIVMNNAAAFVFGKVEDVTRADWDKVMGVNVIGSANVVRFALPHLKKSNAGAVVNMASVSSFVAAPAFVPYNASKGALLQLTRSLAMDLAADGIRVNCVCPGAIYTPATEKHFEFTGQDRGEFFEQEANESFLKRFGTPEEVAFAALFLASDEASFITGAHLVVDGGATV
ncbi:SDR family NAD(P)-dependent oxidoreductase [Roseibium album]|uniref:Cyclopentanol dehydrogenase n=2 Tax=Roseibium album TaxID=311410 RepID=A0A0M6ZM99_9HYPH|nr:SDR family oxidoreductase [Roseibium album]CTQ63250.1 Cyclopentanol dehydrogenase [Roseibium album]CTQ69079.1 Cyclopentanol dehydrogenase [Roseibium album]CTQ80807.1 Cyclopentanol dehydrogenase [Roseibium album]